TLPILKAHKFNRTALLLTLVSLLCVLVIAHDLSPQILKYNTPETMSIFKKLHGISMSLNLIAMLSIIAAPLFLRKNNSSAI
ncbi:MAG: hypothetical protein ABIP97_03620, partial [Chthoniobacterales bacterium]